MEKSKLTLIVDGNWLLMSRLPILNGRYADEQSLMQEVKLLMIKSINVVLRTFPMIDNIMFVSDGGSWRKDIPVPEYAKTKKGDAAEYKGNRERTETIDWDLVFAEFNNFVKVLEDNGISAFHENKIEGDDWCWYLSNELNARGTNVIIWTKDRDITQLVKTNKDGCFTVVWNKDNGVFLTKDDDPTNFLLNPVYQANEQILIDIINRSIKSNDVNTDKIKVDKIVRGDAGDNIMPIITKKSKSGGDRIYRVPEKLLPEHLDIDNQEEVEAYIDYVLNTKQFAGKNIESVYQILDHFKYNRKMVVLDELSYPDYILEVMHRYDNWIDEHPLSVNCNQAEAVILADKQGISSILDEI